MRRKLSGYFRLAITVTVMSVMSAHTLLAIPANDLNAIRNRKPWYNPQDVCVGASPVVANAASGPAYILGDSITNQSETKYLATLTNKGFLGSKVNGSDSRSIDNKGTSAGKTTTGLEALDTDQDAVRTAKVIVIALGTNGGVDTAKIETLIEKVKTLNQAAPIYWVDTMVIGRAGYVSTINSSNSAIYDNSATSGYKVISWANRVSSGANPKALTGSETDPESLIRQADQYVHPTAVGEDALTQLVTESLVAGVNVAVAESETLCSIQCSAENLEFEDGEIERIVFQFFTGVGLTAEQTAGIMGNMAHESGFRPQRLQGTDLNVITPANQVPRNQSAKAWGLVQWDPAHKLIDPVTAAGKDPNNPRVQLDYLWGQLNNKWPEGWPGSPPEGGFFEKAAGDRVRAASTIEEATRAFATYERFRGYEDPNNPKYTDRINAARAAYDLYKGLAPASVSGSATDSCGDAPVINGIEYPPGMEPHPTLGGQGYFKMPENEVYTLSGPEKKRYGSRPLIGAIYTVAKAYKAALKESSTVAVGNLNTNYKDPSVSHRWGTAIDMGAYGEKVAANRLRAGYNTEATIILGKLWADTGMIKQILWCPTDNSATAIEEYANSVGKPIKVTCVEGHADHFHVDLKNEYRLPEANTY